MTDIIRNWIFGPSDFEKPNTKTKNKKVVKIIGEGESKTQDNSPTISSSKMSRGATKPKRKFPKKKNKRSK